LSTLQFADLLDQGAGSQLQDLHQKEARLLRLCKEVLAVLMRLVLAGCLGEHSTVIAGNMMAHAPLLHAELQAMVTGLILYAITFH
jgi:hypothetical protein